MSFFPTFLTSISWPRHMRRNDFKRALSFFTSHLCWPPPHPNYRRSRGEAWPARKVWAEGHAGCSWTSRTAWTAGHRWTEGGPGSRGACRSQGRHGPGGPGRSKGCKGFFSGYAMRHHRRSRLQGDERQVLERLRWSLRTSLQFLHTCCGVWVPSVQAGIRHHSHARLLTARVISSGQWAVGSEWAVEMGKSEVRCGGHGERLGRYLCLWLG